MITFKQHLEEKSVKGIELKRYLINPTPMEAFSFFKRTRKKSVRILVDRHNPKTLWMWDSYDMIHVYFYVKEVLMSNKSWNLFLNAPEIDFEYRGNIDPEDNGEGTFIGKEVTRNHKKFLEDLEELLWDGYGMKARIVDFSVK